MGKPRKPTVVIAEDQIFWEVGIDFGSALRQRGLRVVRLLSPASSSPELERRRRVTAVLCDQIVLNAYEGQDGLSTSAREQLIDPGVLDVQCGEDVLDRIHRELAGRVRPPAANLPLGQAVDKVAVHQFLAEHGIATPATAEHPDHLDRHLPGPFMVKARAGAGGEFATRCQTLAEVRAFYASHPDASLMVQRFVAGEGVVSAGVARDGEVIQAVAYRNVLRQSDPYGAALAIVIAEIPDLMELTRDVVRAMGISGPFAIDAVRDADGQLLTLDVNLRIWGGWSAVQESGVDVVGSYLHSLGLAPHPGPVKVTPGRYELLRFDQDLIELGVTPAAWLAAGLRLVRARRSYLGTKWAAITTMRLGLQAAKRVRPVLSRREQLHDEAPLGELIPLPVRTGGGDASQRLLPPEQFERLEQWG